MQREPQPGEGAPHRGLEPLGRRVEQLAARRAASAAHAVRGAPPASRRRVEEGGAQPSLGHGVDLVLHQGDERGDHQRRPAQQPGRELVGQRLAGAGRHHADAVPPGQHRLDDLALAGPESRDSRTPPAARRGRRPAAPPAPTAPARRRAATPRPPARRRRAAGATPREAPPGFRRRPLAAPDRRDRRRASAPRARAPRPPRRVPRSGPLASGPASPCATYRRAPDGSRLGLACPRRLGLACRPSAVSLHAGEGAADET